jgi:hypothetical protein
MAIDIALGIVLIWLVAVLFVMALCRAAAVADLTMPRPAVQPSVNDGQAGSDRVEAA